MSARYLWLMLAFDLAILCAIFASYNQARKNEREILLNREALRAYIQQQ